MKDCQTHGVQMKKSVDNSKMTVRLDILGTETTILEPINDYTKKY